jgi:hypothetical protein
MGHFMTIVASITISSNPKSDHRQTFVRRGRVSGACGSVSLRAERPAASARAPFIAATQVAEAGD